MDGPQTANRDRVSVMIRDLFVCVSVCLCVGEKRKKKERKKNKKEELMDYGEYIVNL
jgi:hypothetical protein